MTHRLTSLRDQLIIAYRQAWKNLWASEPPVIRKVGISSVVICTGHGSSSRLNMKNFAGRINDMRFWASNGDEA